MLRLLPKYRNKSSLFLWDVLALKMRVLLWVLWVSLEHVAECGPRQKVIGI